MEINLEIEQQVVEIKLAIKLKRLGAKQNSYFVWYKGELMPRKDLPGSSDDNDIFAAFTSQELGWFLPKIAEYEGVKIYLGMDKHEWDWEMWYENGDDSKWKDCYVSTDNEVHGRGHVLAILLENNVVPK